MDNLSEVKQLKCIVIGGGQRGSSYSLYAMDFPHLVKIVAIADPNPSIQKKFKNLYKLNEDQIFDDWSNILKKDKFADFVMICTPDRLHKAPAVAMADKGYHILLEKPMATTLEDCKDVVEASKRNNVMLAICHVLRYYPPNIKIKQLIDSGIIGDVVTIQHLEPVGFYHFAHSYVRGNWRNEKESSFSLLAKSCHDIDLLCYWMSQECKAVSSFGSLNHFKKENKPPGAAKRCVDCEVEKQCAYSALKIYLEPAKRGHFGWPVSVVTDVEDLDVLTGKLKKGPYGRCVYQSDNDVCDNQVLNLEFEGGKTASFTMVAFTESICSRRTQVFGTKGELTYEGGTEVSHFDFLTRTKKFYSCGMDASIKTSLRGHAGADFCLMDSFVKAVASNDRSLLRSGPNECLTSHEITFIAEQSRKSGKTFRRDNDGSWSTQ